MPRSDNEILNEVYPEGGSIGTVYASAARTTLQTGSDITNNVRARGIKLVIDITAIVDTPSLTFTVQGKDVLSGKYYNMLVSAALGSVATTVLTIFPGATASANVVANDTIPNKWRVNVAVGDADEATYSVGFSYLY